MKLTRPISWQDVKDDFCEDVGEVTLYHIFLLVMSGLCPPTMALTIPLTYLSIPFESIAIGLHTISNLKKCAEDSLSTHLNSTSDKATSTKQIFNAMNISSQNCKPKQEKGVNDQIDRKESIKQNKPQINNVANLNDCKDKSSISLRM